MEAWASVEKGWWSVMRKLGCSLAGVFVSLGISANQLTIGRFIIFAPCVIVCYSMPGYWWPVAGFACLFTNTLLDFTDGAVARATGNTSVLGAWIDGRHDFLMQGILLSGCAIHVCMSDSGMYGVLVSVAALFSQAALTHHCLMYKGVFDHRETFFKDLTASTDLRLWQRVMIDIAITESSASVVVFTYRYWVLIFTFAGRIDLLLLVIAITQNIRWIILHVMMAVLFADEKGKMPLIWQKMRRYMDTSYRYPKGDVEL